VPQPYLSLGTDGYGLSDAKAALRRYFEVDAGHVVVGVLHSLAVRGDLKPEVVADAIARFDIDPEALDPVTV
jgi:pyruvate dehydrogenase E1 component